MPDYPDYVYKTIAQARQDGQWHAAQADAAALCFDILAQFPECPEASELVYELFCDEWAIYDNRVALQRLIEEWDDRPWQCRRRLALSFRFMSRWDGWDHVEEPDGPGDVRKILEDGKMELLGAYCLGDEECTNYAWSIFSDALDRTGDPHGVLLWIARTYADLGFFADAAEALGELCSRFHDAAARRLLAEVIWWRDNAYRIPWTPPGSDGTRYRRMIQQIDPSAVLPDEEVRRVRLQHQLERIAPYCPSIDPRLAEVFAGHVTDDAVSAAPALVDWNFLDQEDGLPDEPADWVKDEIHMLEAEGTDETAREMIREIQRMHRWTRNIPPPSTPPRYDPDEPPFDPYAALGDSDLD